MGPPSDSPGGRDGYRASVVGLVTIEAAAGPGRSACGRPNPAPRPVGYSSSTTSGTKPMTLAPSSMTVRPSLIRKRMCLERRISSFASDGPRVVEVIVCSSVAMPARVSRAPRPGRRSHFAPCSRLPPPDRLL